MSFLTEQVSEMQKQETTFDTELIDSAKDWIFEAVHRSVFGRPNDDDASSTLRALNDLHSLGAIDDRDAYLAKVVSEVKTFRAIQTEQAILFATADDAKQAKLDLAAFDQYALETRKKLVARVNAFAGLRKSRARKPTSLDAETRIEKLITDADREAINAAAANRIAGDPHAKPIVELPGEFMAVIRESVAKSPRYNHRLRGETDTRAPEPPAKATAPEPVTPEPVTPKAPKTETKPDPVASAEPIAPAANEAVADRPEAPQAESPSVDLSDWQ